MDSRSLLTILPVLIVAGWACVLLILDAFLPKDRKGVTPVLAALGLVAGTVALITRFNQEASAFGGMIIIDGFASMLQLLFLVLGIVAIAQAYDYLHRHGIARGEYYSLLLFSLSGMMLMASAGDLIVVFVSLELLSIPLYVMAGFARPKLASEESAMKYFLLGAFASGFVVYGIALIFGVTGTTQLSGVFESIQMMNSIPVLSLVGGGMIMVGLGFKVAAVPFHMWTPDVYHGAPTSVTSFMSVGAKAGGFAALLRILVAAFPGTAEYWGPLSMWIAALTMAWGNVAAIAQSNIKRMLAYSSIAHAGYIFMALPAAAIPAVAPEALRGALFYLIAYGITNLGAWGVVLALEQVEGKGLEIEEYAGLGAKYPVLALAMVVFMLSLTGVPPTVGFMGKFYLFRAAIDANLIWLAIVGVITSLISAYYYLRVIVVMYMQEGTPERRSEVFLNATVILSAIATVLFGLLPGPLMQLASRASLLPFLP